jgi:hypothetical protein
MMIDPEIFQLPTSIAGEETERTIEQAGFSYDQVLLP